MLVIAEGQRERGAPTVVMTSEEYLQGRSRMCMISRNRPRHSVLFMVTAPYTCMRITSSTLLRPHIAKLPNFQTALWAD